MLLTRLNEHISSTDSCRLAVWGLGGCGKTALALETAYHTRRTQPKRVVFWVPAVSQTSFDQAFREIGEQLRIPNITDSRSNVKQLVKARLSDESLGPWLLIIDNADDPDILYSPLDGRTGVERLIDDLPYSRKGSIIITTRTSHIAVELAEHNVIELGRLNETEAKELVRTRLLPKHQHQVGNTTTVKEFLSMLEYFALAIVQAVAYINKGHSNLAKYIRLFKTSERDASQLLSREFSDQGRPSGTQNPVATTWYISFEQARRQNALAAEYLSFMACTANTDIPASMLPTTESELDQEDAIGLLKAYGFITQRQHQSEEVREGEEEGDQIEAFDIHPLVHLATRTWLKAQKKWDSCIVKTVERMRELVPFGDMKTRRTWTPFLPHATHVCDLAKPDHAESRADLIYRVARCHYALGQYRVAEQGFRELLAYEESTLGEKHPNTLDTLNWIGESLRESGYYRQAEQMHRRTLALREEILGKEDLDTLTSMNDLAITLEKQGKYVEAEQMHRQGMLLREAIYGKKHIVTLTSMHNLAVSLNSQSKSAEAEQMLRKTVELREKVIGKDHPDTLKSIGFLASTLKEQKKCQEAEEMYRKTLDLSKRVLGVEHPVTLVRMNNLAETLSDQGKYQEAEEMHRRTLHLTEKLLGVEHSDTLVSMSNLAGTLSDQAKYQEAEEMHRRAIGLTEKVLGVEHSDTLISMSHLARTLSAQGRYQEAEEMHRKILGLREKVFGIDHLDTLISMSHLAGTLSAQGRYQEAEEMHRRVLGLKEKALGMEHTDTLQSSWWVGFVLQEQGRYEEALPFYERTCEGFGRLLGADHEETQNCAEEYAYVRRMAAGGLSDSEDGSPSDEAYDSLGEQIGQANFDPGDLETRDYPQHDEAAQKEETEEEKQRQEEGGQHSESPNSQTLEGPDNIPEASPSMNEDEMQVCVKDDALIQKAIVERQGGADKRPPPPKAKPSGLKGLPLRGLKSNNQAL
ncbi:hypothetical protein N0V86_002766 [Didymella sp. IMI 355093]|nr:hypothetical protein N0V86_002766 [Didymella sp. IMI 355093]